MPLKISIMSYALEGRTCEKADASPQNIRIAIADRVGCSYSLLQAKSKVLFYKYL
jgi:hypothetical protein